MKRGTGRIIGATIVAKHAEEMVSEIILAMVNGPGLEALANVVPPHPG